MAQAMAFAAPTTEEITKSGIGLVGGGVTGLVEGVVISLAEGFGALKPVISWGTLLGAPAVGVAGALLLKGMIGDLFQGIAAGSAAVLGYSLPALVKPYLPTKEQAGQGAQRLSGVKQLPAGPASAPQKAQEQAARALGSWAFTPEDARGVVGQGHTVRDYS